MDILFFSAEYCLAFSFLLMLSTYQAFPCLFCVQSPVLIRVFHSPSVSCFMDPFLVSVSYFSLSLLLSGSWSSALYIGLTLCLPFGLCLPLPGPLLVYLDYPSCQALWILFTDRRPRPFTWVLICLALNISVCHLFDPACVFDHVIY